MQMFIIAKNRIVDSSTLRKVCLT